MTEKEQTIDEEALMTLLITLSSLVELRDSYTEGHCERVRDWVIRLSTEMQLSEEESRDLLIGAVLHDIGKIGIPDAVLQKAGKLTDEEFTIIKQHPLIGADALRAYDEFKNACLFIRHHHERWDGKGYPDGLKGEDIPIGSRIIAVLDTYDALTSDRPYRKAMPTEKAINILQNSAAGQFDEAILSKFIQIQQNPEVDSSIDPVCGMKGNKTRQHEHDGKLFYFCSEACRNEFANNIDKYAL